MPKNFKIESRKWVRNRKPNKRKSIVKKFGILILLSILASVLAYFLFYQILSLKIENQAISQTIFFLSLVLLVLMLGFIFYTIHPQGFKKRFYFLWPNFRHTMGVKGKKAWRIKRDLMRIKRNLFSVKRKHLLGFSILIIALTGQYYPSIYSPFNSFITRLVYNPTPPISSSPWPWKEHKTIHPVIASMTPDIEKNIKSVAEYIAKQEPDPYLQIKALHDYVISRVTYDLDVLETGIRPSQDAQTVFKTHKAVCEGYAKLFLALGRAIGIDVVYIRGKVREDFASVDLIPQYVRFLKPNYDWTLHAWNAVKIGGNWQLVDTTWDDNSDSNDLNSSYSADYLMLPPKVLIMSHLPEQKDWQLLDNPENETSFEEQPILKPQFFIEGLKLVLPNKYKQNVQQTALIEIESPPQSSQKIFAFFSKRKESEFSLWNWQSSHELTQEKKPDVERCKSQSSARGKTQISCHFPEPGDYQILLFSEISPIAQLRFHSLKAGN